MVILVFVVGALFAAMQVRATERRRAESLEAYADLLGRLVLSNLRDGMLTKDRGRLQGLLTRLREIEPIVQVRVVNKAGVVIYADEPGALGEILGRDDPSCVSCHRDAQPPRQRSATVRLRPAEGGEVFRAIQPIHVEAECAGCHEEPQGSVIGIVMTDIDRERLTGALGRQTAESIWAFVGAGALILLALGLLVRRLVVSRLRNLSRLLELLRGGARTMSLPSASGDEIDDLARAAHGLVLDLDERFAVERALHRVAPVLARHAGPALILDDRGVVVAANRRAQERLGDDATEALVGRARAALQHDPGPLVALAREQGWALADDPEGAGVFALVRADGTPVGFLELWCPAPTEAVEPRGQALDDVAAGAKPSVARLADADWRLYAAVVLQEISARTSPWRGVLRLDARLSLARRMLAELAEVASEELAQREEIDLAALALLVRSDVQRARPQVRWHAALDPPAKLVGARYQLRALLTRLTTAAAVQAGEGGHVVQFCYAARRSDAVFVGAWASRPGVDGVDTALVDPPLKPPLAHAIASAHGGGFEVDPSYDLGALAELRSVRLPTSGPGTLYVAELHRGGAS